MNKVDKTEYNFIGFDGCTSIEQAALRSNLINKLYVVLTLLPAGFSALPSYRGGGFLAHLVFNAVPLN